MNIKEKFVRRWGNADGYEDGKVYSEVLDNKLYKTHQNGVVRFKKRIDGTVSTDAENRKNLELLIPKIPFKYYMMTLDFYKYIQKEYGTEACVLFFWNINNVEIPADLLKLYGDGIIQDGQLIVIAPKQKNSGTLSQYVETVTVNGVAKQELTPMVKWLESNTKCIMETHSHHTMDAFWSGTDDANEKHNALRLFSVFGKITTEEKVLSRVCMLGDYFAIPVEDIFEMPTLETETVVTNYLMDGDLDVSTLVGGKSITTKEEPSVYTGPFKYAAAFPVSWLEMYSEIKYTVPTVSYFGDDTDYSDGFELDFEPSNQTNLEKFFKKGSKSQVSHNKYANKKPIGTKQGRLERNLAKISANDKKSRKNYMAFLEEDCKQVGKNVNLLNKDLPADFDLTKGKYVNPNYKDPHYK